MNQTTLDRITDDINRSVSGRPVQMPPYPATPRIEPAPGRAPVVDLGTGNRDHLAALHQMLTEPMRVPEIGVASAQAMQNCYETVASDIEKVAQDHLDRAQALVQEAQTFASIIRESGQRLCEKIQQDAARGMQVSVVMRSARQLLGETAEPK